MRDSETNLKIGGVSMGCWWVSGLLLGAYNNIIHRHNFLVSYCVDVFFIVSVFQNVS